MPESTRARKGPQQERLSAYTAKDYTEVIEFPVELVDRDGVVRRYSYEESLAVYHRRIQSAPWRFGDEEIVRAEIGHCTRRIDQLKRSYLLRAELAGPTATADPRAALGEGYEVLRRHYSRLLRDRKRPSPEPDLPLKVTLLHDDPSCRAYHVAGPDGEGGHVLYVYPFDRRGDGEPDGAFQAASRQYRMTAQGAEVERLLLEERGRETGYLLCGVEELPPSLLAMGRGEDEDATEGPAALCDIPTRERPGGIDLMVGVEALREGEPERALAHLREAVRENPWNRDGYVALLSVLDGLDRVAEAEFWAALAGAYLPDDGFLRFRHGVQLARQGRFDDAVAAFDEAAERSPSLHHPSLFAAQVLLARGRQLSGARRRLERAAQVAPDDEDVRKLLRIVVRAVRVRRGGMAVGTGIALAGVIGLAAGMSAGLWLVASGVATAVAAWPITALWLMLCLRRQAAAEG